MARLLSVGVTTDAAFELSADGVKAPARVAIYLERVIFTPSEGNTEIRLVITHDEWDFISGVVADAIARLKAESEQQKNEAQG